MVRKFKFLSSNPDEMGIPILHISGIRLLTVPMNSV